MEMVQKRCITTLLERMLGPGELVVQYQPLLGLLSGKPAGAEALVRWHAASGGYVSPMQFVPFLEETGYIGELDHMVWERACRFAAYLLAQGHPVPIAVNCSRATIREPRCVQRYLGQLRDTGVPPELLTLELTETALLKELAPAAAALETLRRQGVRCALDDFGTGYSSLVALQDLPIDILKLDAAFLRGCGADEPRSRAIVRALVQMAHELHIRVVAEGAETLESICFLRALECDFAQGFYYASPMVPELFETWLAGILQHSDSLVNA